MSENKHIKFFLIILYVILGIAGLWVLFKYALPWFAPFILAFIFSRIIEYPVGFFEKKLRIPRPISSLLFTLIFYAAIGTLLYFATQSLIDWLVGLFDKLKTINITTLVDNITETFNSLISSLPTEAQSFIYTNMEGWLSELVSLLQKLISPIISYTAKGAAFLPSVFIFIIATIASTYFLSADYPKLRKKILDKVSPSRREQLRRIRNKLSTTLFAYVRAVIILISITFVELAIGLLILGVDNALLIAGIIAIIDALPVLGTGWVIMPWAIFSIIAGKYGFAIGLVLIYIVVTIVRNLIEPKIVGEHIGLHPLATLTSIYIGLKFFGLIGMFTPIVVALLKSFYDWGYLDFFKSEKNSGADKPNKE